MNKDKTKEHIAKLIRKEISWLNGWSASEEGIQQTCELAATKILRYLERAK